jgi:hypothetical protein
MSKRFIKYLSFLGILLLFNASGLHASSACNSNTILKAQQEIEVDNSVDNNRINSISQDYKDKLSFYVVEAQHEEIEETSNSDKVESINNFTSALINAELFNWLSFQHKKNKYYNKKYFYQSSTKLHIIFQVFII